MAKVRKDVLLIANYWHFEEEKASSRYRSFADILCEKYDLEVITSTFCHLKKQKRNVESLNLQQLPYKVVLCEERGYQKNISIRRIRSYKKFGKNVKNYLKNRRKPDLIIVSVPSLSVADYTTKYAKKNNIPIIVDIQDLWPEAFKMAISLPIISDILFLPMLRQANKIYARADEIMAVSNTYVERGLKHNKRAKGLSIYIGTDGDLVREKVQGVETPKDENNFVVGYVGALGHSYDIKSVIDAIKVLQDKGRTNIIFKVMGDGVCRGDFESYAKTAGIKYEFTGLLEYGKMMATLMQCNVAVNPIVGKSVSSIINKVSDYAAAGMPVINTQNSVEYRKLLEEYKAGINVENGNVNAIADAIELYYVNEQKRLEASNNAKKMFDELFDRAKNYPKLIEVIEELT